MKAWALRFPNGSYMCLRESGRPLGAEPDFFAEHFGQTFNNALMFARKEDAQDFRVAIRRSGSLGVAEVDFS